MNRIATWLLALLVLLGAAWLALRAPDTDSLQMRSKYGAAPSQFVALAPGLTVHLRDEGPRDAPVIVLLHGSNADLHTWDAWTALLRDRYRVIRFDQIGHGLTGPSPRGDYRREAFAGTVEQVAQKLGLGQFVLGGNSMGGGIALEYALTHPERVKALVLIDAAGAPVDRPGRGNIGFRLAAMPGARLLMRSITPRSLIERSIRQTVANQAIVTPAMVDRYWELLRYPGNRVATARRFALPRTPFSAGQMAQLRMPVLILWGDEDPLIPRAAADWFHRAIPGSSLIGYPGIGHIPMEEAAPRSAGDLAAFLSAHGLAGKAG